MKKKDLKKLTRDQSIKELDKSKKDLFNYRFQKINGQIKNYSNIKETRKKIARLMTKISIENGEKNA